MPSDAPKAVPQALLETHDATRTAQAAVRPIDQVVVPVGGTDREFLAQQEAAEFASALGVPLLGVHVAPSPEDIEDGVFGYIHDACQRLGVDFEPRVLLGNDPAEQMLEELGPLDLVVVGTRRLGDRFHVGSIVERLIAGAPCRVQVIRLDR